MRLRSLAVPFHMLSSVPFHEIATTILCVSFCGRQEQTLMKAIRYFYVMCMYSDNVHVVDSCSFNCG